MNQVTGFFYTLICCLVSQLLFHVLGMLQLENLIVLAPQEMYSLLKSGDGGIFVADHQTLQQLTSLLSVGEHYLKKILVEFIRKPKLLVSSNREKSFQTLYRGRQKELRRSREPKTLKSRVADRVSHGQDRTRHHQPTNQIRVQLTQLERNHATVAEPNHRTRVHPQFPQTLADTLGLEPRRPVGVVGDGAAEEEEVRDVDGVFFGKRTDLELPRHDAFAGEAVDEDDYWFVWFGFLGGVGGGLGFF